jgi:hypothetical protein
MEDAYISCDMDLRGLKALTTIGHWGIGRWQMPNNDVWLPSTITSLTWEAFNGSRIKNLYWNCKPSDITYWNSFEGADEQIKEYVDNLFTFIDEYIPAELINEFIDAILGEIFSYDDGLDVFIFGNLEIEQFHAGSAQNATDWAKRTAAYDSGDNVEGRGNCLPDLFWMVGMADCPRETHVTVVA